MGKPEFDLVEKNFGTLKSIKEKATLSESSFKSLVDEVKEFVENNEESCKSTPRQWSFERWKRTTSECIKEGNLGKKYFNKDRENCNEEDDLIWPDDKSKISFLVFCIMKYECSRVFSGKRKSTGEDEPTTPKKTPKSAKGSDSKKQKTTPHGMFTSKPGGKAPKKASSKGQAESESDEEEEDGNLKGARGTEDLSADPFRNVRASNSDAEVSQSRATSHPSNASGLEGSEQKGKSFFQISGVHRVKTPPTTTEAYVMSLESKKGDAAVGEPAEEDTNREASPNSVKDRRDNKKATKPNTDDGDDTITVASNAAAGYEADEDASESQEGQKESSSKDHAKSKAKDTKNKDEGKANTTGTNAAREKTFSSLASVTNGVFGPNKCIFEISIGDNSAWSLPSITMSSETSFTKVFGYALLKAGHGMPRMALAGATKCTMSSSNIETKAFDMGGDVGDPHEQYKSFLQEAIAANEDDDSNDLTVNLKFT